MVLRNDLSDGRRLEQPPSGARRQFGLGCRPHGARELGHAVRRGLQRVEFDVVEGAVEAPPPARTGTH